MAVIPNFNKIIDIQLISKDGTIHEIKWSGKGRKPNITVTGTFLPKNNMNNFEVRISNCYISIQEYEKIKLSCGYEENKAETIEGSITNRYIEKPAPEQVVLFECLTANYTNWCTKTVNLKFKVGDSIKDIISKISTELKFASPNFAEDISETLKAPLNETGLCSNVIQQIKNLFPELNILIDSNRITVTKEKGTGKKFVIKYLSSPPQILGNQITFVAPWDPQIRPDDIVQLKMETFKKDGIVATDVKLYSEYKILSMSFEFSTVGSENSMTIQAEGVESKK